MAGWGPSDLKVILETPLLLRHDQHQTEAGSAYQISSRNTSSPHLKVTYMQILSLFLSLNLRFQSLLHVLLKAGSGKQPLTILRIWSKQKVVFTVTSLSASCCHPCSLYAAVCTVQENVRQALATDMNIVGDFERPRPLYVFVLKLLWSVDLIDF